MKIKFVINFVLIFLVSIPIFGQRPDFQSKFILKGKVVDSETLQPLEYATISIININKPNNIEGGITDKNGAFNIELSRGKYNVKIEFISFKEFSIENLTINTDTDLETVKLEIDIDQLENVDLIAERTEVEIRLDKRIYNVGKDITVRGGSVADVLDNVPSVSVDIDGNVSLRGNNSVRILINGKPSGLVGLSGTNGLQQIPAESIDKVEVITSPSARYESEGTGGILNIILKKDSLEGLNGNIIANAGLPENYGGSTRFNFKKNNVNFFNTTSFKDGFNRGKGIAFNTYFNGIEPTTYLDEKRSDKRQLNNLFSNLGVDISFNDTSSLIISGFISNSDNTNNNITTYKNLDSFKNITNESIRERKESEFDETKQLSVNYTKKFKRVGHEVVFEYQYEDSNEIEDGIFNNQTIFPEFGSVFIDKLVTDEKQKRSLYQLDYILPFNKNSQFEFGYRGSFRDLLTDYKVSEFINNQNILDLDKSNILNFKEYINAFYSQYGNKINKFSYLLGLRVESSNITIDQRTINQFKIKKYTDLFPTLNFSYEFNEKSSLTLGYSRRLRRPRSRFLNPFGSRVSIANAFQGNVDLNPSYSNTYDLGFLTRSKKLTFNGSVYYSKSKSVIQIVNQATGDFATISKEPLVKVPVLKAFPVNLTNNYRTGTEFNITYTPNRKFRINSNLNIFNSKLTGSYNNISYDSENLSWFARMNASLKLPKEIDSQLRLFYRGPSKTAEAKVKGFMILSGAINKNVLNKKATLSFRISDILNSSKFRVTTSNDQFIAYREFRRREPTYTLTFTYKINERKADNRRSRNNNFNRGDDSGGYGY